MVPESGESCGLLSDGALSVERPQLDLGALGANKSYDVAAS